MKQTRYFEDQLWRPGALRHGKMNNRCLILQKPRKHCIFVVGEWWAMQGLNLRPLPCEGSALPLSYAPLILGGPDGGF